MNKVSDKRLEELIGFYQYLLDNDVVHDSSEERITKEVLSSLKELQSLRKKFAELDKYARHGDEVMDELIGERNNLKEQNKELLKDGERSAQELILIDSWNLDSFSNEDVDRIYNVIKQHKELRERISG